MYSFLCAREYNNVIYHDCIYTVLRLGYGYGEQKMNMIKQNKCVFSVTYDHLLKTRSLFHEAFLVYVLTYGF